VAKRFQVTQWRPKSSKSYQIMAKKVPKVTQL
jgi:hypothetical protein